MSQVQILVVGDAMLDTYWFGQADRLSPEAPVPVIDRMHETEHPGGAANVAANLAAMGAEVTLSGVVGDDAYGARLQALVKEAGLVDDLFVDPDRPTTHKLRILAGQQQIVRVDHESRQHLAGAVEAAWVARIAAAAADFDAIVVSDYGKGAVSEALCKALCTSNTPVYIDPCPAHAAWYEGATVVTPNRREAEGMERQFDLVGDEGDFQQLVAATGVQEGLLVTMGPDGLLFVGADGTKTRSVARARAVYDVSGAGDTVLAAFVLCRASGAGILAAMEVANHCAGAVVAELGTAVVDKAAMQRYMQEAGL